MQDTVIDDSDLDEAPGYVAALRTALGMVPLATLRTVLTILEQAYANGSRIFVCGNGGSAATASHLAVDLAKGTRCPGARPLRVISLSDHVAALTAWGNDAGYESVFAGQLAGLAEPDDVVVVISASGESPNVLEALRCGRDMGAVTVALLGTSGGKARHLADVSLLAPGRSIEQQEDVHLVLAHAITRHMRAFVRASRPLAASIQRDPAP